MGGAIAPRGLVNRDHELASFIQPLDFMQTTQGYWLPLCPSLPELAHNTGANRVLTLPRTLYGQTNYEQRH